MAQPVHAPKLYERDFVAWCEETIAKLKAHDLESLDLDSLIEEIEGLAGRDRRELESRLQVLLEHLLKRLYVSSPYDHRGWQNTIHEQRRELRLLLKQSPSLRNYLTNVFDEAWQNALTQVKRDYAKELFPDQWPFSGDIDALLDNQFWLADEDL
ncbi:MAG: DUF29 domain-containing protein [Leptolyngbyaceae cyanobacterium SM2_5_2]|nr:DUF29 domain-containing protein [Leptolyngbyaceae cyanobacterium SM2_5_2]